MTGRRANREWAAILPWLGAGFLWFGVIVPMRTDQATRLAEQTRIRRDRIKVDLVTRENQALGERIRVALGAACRSSVDPAQLRERVVAATAGLSLSPFALSVVGGPSAGAGVDAEGTRSTVLQLISRLGDPGRGGFLRTASVRDKGSRWGVTLTAGVFESLPAGSGPGPSSCAPDPVPAVAEPLSEAARPVGSSSPARQPLPAPLEGPGVSLTPVPPAPTPVSPLTLIAFLTSGGKSSVSIRVDDQVRVVSVGGQANGWTCVSIDRDQGAVFVSPSGVRLVLNAGQ